jgi:hypothetical protein
MYVAFLALTIHNLFATVLNLAKTRMLCRSHQSVDREVVNTKSKGLRITADMLKIPMY